MTTPSPDLYKAYHRATQTVAKTRQVVMLFDGAIRFLQQGIEAIEAKDYETRFKKLSRVSQILIGLQSALDFNQGGLAAHTLYDFYASMDRRIIVVQRTNDLVDCQAILAEVKAMRDVWSRIDIGDASPAAAATPPTDAGTDTGTTFSA